MYFYYLPCFLCATCNKQLWCWCKYSGIWCGGFVVCCLHTHASLSVHNISGSSFSCLMRSPSLSLPSHYLNVIVSSIRAAVDLCLDRERRDLFSYEFNCWYHIASVTDNEYGTLVKWQGQTKAEVLGEKLVLVLFCPPVTPHSLPRYQTPASAVRNLSYKIFAVCWTNNVPIYSLCLQVTNWSVFRYRCENLSFS